MKKLLVSRKFNAGKRPSTHDVKAGAFARDHGGSIPPNVFELEPLDPNRTPRLPNAFSFANTASADAFTKACKNAGVVPHPARMPIGLANFFVEFLTAEGELVFDPFGGSNTTGFAAETAGRKWISVEADVDFAEQARIRMGLVGRQP
jgi:site-specific DNA-methyltransferase (cytosine-N4-specific)